MSNEASETIAESTPCSTEARDPLGRGCEEKTDENLPVNDHLIIAELVRQLHAGKIATETLTPEMRRQCVAQLSLEGFTNSEIAQLMRISERTVRRDRLTARRDDALAPGRSLGDELLGEFQRLTLASIQRLTRLARDAETPAYARMWAEESMVRIYQRFLDTAHRLRYFEDGRARLAYQRDTDPAEQERFEQVLASLRGMAVRG